MNLDQINIGGIVHPAGDGEDPTTGRVIRNTSARFRVLAAWGTRVEVTIVRSGGMYGRGRLELDLDQVVPADDIAAPKPRTVKAHTGI
jgi:hypothetical protein